MVDWNLGTAGHNVAIYQLTASIFSGIVLQSNPVG